MANLLVAVANCLQALEVRNPGIALSHVALSLAPLSLPAVEYFIPGGLFQAKCYVLNGLAAECASTHPTIHPSVLPTEASNATEPASTPCKECENCTTSTVAIFETTTVVLTTTALITPTAPTCTPCTSCTPCEPPVTFTAVITTTSANCTPETSSPSDAKVHEDVGSQPLQPQSVRTLTLSSCNHLLALLTYGIPSSRNSRADTVMRFCLKHQDWAVALSFFLHLCERLLLILLCLTFIPVFTQRKSAVLRGQIEWRRKMRQEYRFWTFRRWRGLADDDDDDDGYDGRDTDVAGQGRSAQLVNRGDTSQSRQTESSTGNALESLDQELPCMKCSIHCRQSGAESASSPPGKPQHSTPRTPRRKTPPPKTPPQNSHPQTPQNSPPGSDDLYTLSPGVTYTAPAGTHTDSLTRLPSYLLEAAPPSVRNDPPPKLDYQRQAEAALSNSSSSSDVSDDMNPDMQDALFEHFAKKKLEQDGNPKLPAHAQSQDNDVSEDTAPAESVKQSILDRDDALHESLTRISRFQNWNDTSKTSKLRREAARIPSNTAADVVQDSHDEAYNRLLSRLNGSILGGGASWRKVTFPRIGRSFKASLAQTSELVAGTQGVDVQDAAQEPQSDAEWDTSARSGQREEAALANLLRKREEHRRKETQDDELRNLEQEQAVQPGEAEDYYVTREARIETEWDADNAPESTDEAATINLLRRRGEHLRSERRGVEQPTPDQEQIVRKVEAAKDVALPMIGMEAKSDAHKLADGTVEVVIANPPCKRQENLRNEEQGSQQRAFGPQATEHSVSEQQTSRQKALSAEDRARRTMIALDVLFDIIDEVVDDENVKRVWEARHAPGRSSEDSEIDHKPLASAGMKAKSEDTAQTIPSSGVHDQDTAETKQDSEAKRKSSKTAARKAKKDADLVKKAQEVAQTKKLEAERVKQARLLREQEEKAHAAEEQEQRRLVEEAHLEERRRNEAARKEVQRREEEIQESKRIAEAERVANANRIAEAERIAEEKRVVEEKRVAEEKRLDNEKQHRLLSILVEKRRLQEELKELKRAAGEERAAKEQRQKAKSDAEKRIEVERQGSATAARPPQEESDVEHTEQLEQHRKEEKVSRADTASKPEKIMLNFRLKSSKDQPQAASHLEQGASTQEQAEHLPDSGRERHQGPLTGPMPTVDQIGENTSEQELSVEQLMKTLNLDWNDEKVRQEFSAALKKVRKVDEVTKKLVQLKPSEREAIEAAKGAQHKVNGREADAHANPEPRALMAHLSGDSTRSEHVPRATDSQGDAMDVDDNTLAQPPPHSDSDSTEAPVGFNATHQALPIKPSIRPAGHSNSMQLPSWSLVDIFGNMKSNPSFPRPHSVAQLPQLQESNDADMQDLPDAMVQSTLQLQHPVQANVGDGMEVEPTGLVNIAPTEQDVAMDIGQSPAMQSYDRMQDVPTDEVVPSGTQTEIADYPASFNLNDDATEHDTPTKGATPVTPKTKKVADLSDASLRGPQHVSNTRQATLPPSGNVQVMAQEPPSPSPSMPRDLPDASQSTRQELPKKLASPAPPLVPRQVTMRGRSPGISDLVADIREVQGPPPPPRSPLNPTTSEKPPLKLEPSKVDAMPRLTAKDYNRPEYVLHEIPTDTAESKLAPDERRARDMLRKAMEYKAPPPIGILVEEPIDPARAAAFKQRRANIKPVPPETRANTQTDEASPSAGPSSAAKAKRAAEDNAEKEAEAGPTAHKYKADEGSTSDQRKREIAAKKAKDEDTRRKMWAIDQSKQASFQHEKRFGTPLPVHPNIREWDAYPSGNASWEEWLYETADHRAAINRVRGKLAKHNPRIEPYSEEKCYMGWDEWRRNHR